VGLTFWPGLSDLAADNRDVTIGVLVKYEKAETPPTAHSPAPMYLPNRLKLEIRLLWTFLWAFLNPNKLFLCNKPILSAEQYSADEFCAKNRANNNLKAATIFSQSVENTHGTHDKFLTDHLIFNKLTYVLSACTKSMNNKKPNWFGKGYTKWPRTHCTRRRVEPRDRHSDGLTDLRSSVLRRDRAESVTENRNRYRDILKNRHRRRYWKKTKKTIIRFLLLTIY